MLDESEVIRRGIECFKEALRDNVKYGQQYATPWLPSMYKQGGIRFSIHVYLNLSEDRSGGLEFSMHNDFDPFNIEQIEAVQVAIWLHNQISDINLIMMFIGEDYIDSVLSGDAPEGLLRTRERLNLLKDMEIYPHLPPERKQEITNAIALCNRLYAEMIRSEYETQIQAMRSSPRYGFIYLLESTVGYWKIGRSAVPVQRIGKLGVQLPFEIDVEALIETADMYELESGLHKKYEKKRVRGEWFNLDTEDIAYIKSLAVQSW